MAKADKKAKKAAKKEAKAAKKEEKKVNGTPDNGEFKTSLVKCIAAVACVIALCVTTVSNVGKISDAKIKAAETVSAGAGTSESADEASADAAGETAGTDDAAPADETAGTEDAAADETADAADAGDTSADTAASDAAPANNGGSSSASKTAALKSTADIVKYYNTATAKAFNAKVPFTKERNTVEKSYKAGAALNYSKSIVYKFMGVGDANKFSKTVTKEDKDSYHKYLQASKLTAADVTSATCSEAGGKYTIVIKVKDGSSSVSGGKVVSSNNSPLDRSGLACGDNDKDYWDHKTAENVMSAIDEVPLCGSANINEKYTGATITAVIDSATGNLVSLTAKFNFHFDLDKVMSSSGTADSASTVIMKDFKW